MLVKKILKSPILAHLFYLSIVIGAGALVYRDILLSKGPAMEYNDNAGVFYPAFYFAKHSILGGEFPLWDPHQFFGQPMAFNTYSIIYPPVLLLLSLPLKEFYPRCMELLIVSHLILSGVVMYFGSLKLGFSKGAATVSGVIFVIAPSTSNYIFNPPAAFLLAWAPGIVALTIYILRSAEGVNKLKKEFLTVFVLLFMAIMAVSLPILVFLYMSLGIIFAFYFMLSLVHKSDLQSIFRTIKKFLLIVMVPLFLTSFLWFPLLTYSRETVRIIPAPQHTGLGPLYFAHTYTLLFPMFAYGIEDSYAYIGVMTFLLIIAMPIITRKQSSKMLALFSFLGGFWFFFALEKSPLYEEIATLPLFSSLRFSYRALVFFVMFGAWYVGIVLDNLLLEKRKERKDGLEKFWIIFKFILPVILLYCLIITRKQFIAIEKIMPFSETNESVFLYFFKKFYLTVGGMGFFLLLYLLEHFKKLPKILRNLFWIVPVGVILYENLKFYNISPRRSWEGQMSPYKEWAKQFQKKLPEIVADKSLFRVETFGNEQAVLPYYLDYYSVNGVGYIPQGTHPVSYYLLWSRDSAWYGSTYQKPIPETISTTISTTSPIYKLMGVKYFASLNVSGRIVPFEERGVGEYIETFFNDEEWVSGIKIVQPNELYKRRITMVGVYSNDLFIGKYSVKNDSGPQTVRFNPVYSKNIKIEALEVSLNTSPQGDGWVVKDLSFLDGGGSEIPNDRIKEINPSSTFFLSTEKFLTDKLPTEWESDNLINTRKMAEKEGFVYVRDGLLMVKDTFPRAFFTCDYEEVREKEDLLDKLHSESFDPKKLLVYQPEKHLDVSKLDCFKAVEIRKYLHNSVGVEFSNTAPGFLVLTDSYSAGWQVFVDGKKQNILKAYGIFRAVEIHNVGRHTVVFKYIPPNFYKGLIISLSSLVGIIFAIVGFKIKKKKI